MSDRTSTRDRRSGILLFLLGGLAVADGALGLWATFSPRGFYDDFPGGGRTWVSVDGPYNEHLVRDFGSLNLALAVMLAVAAVTLAPLIVRAVAVATIVYGVPHLIYHLRHLDPYDGSDAVANITSLSLAVLAPVAVLLLARESRVVAPGDPEPARTHA